MLQARIQEAEDATRREKRLTQQQRGRDEASQGLQKKTFASK